MNNGYFYVTRMIANDRQTVIGYQVVSRSIGGGERVHYQKKSMTRLALACAYAECMSRAAVLTVEAEANRVREMEGKADV